MNFRKLAVRTMVLAQMMQICPKQCFARACLAKEPCMSAHSNSKRSQKASNVPRRTLESGPKHPPRDPEGPSKTAPPGERAIIVQSPVNYAPNPRIVIRPTPPRRARAPHPTGLAVFPLMGSRVTKCAENDAKFSHRATPRRCPDRGFAIRAPHTRSRRHVDAALDARARADARGISDRKSGV